MICLHSISRDVLVCIRVRIRVRIRIRVGARFNYPSSLHTSPTRLCHLIVLPRLLRGVALHHVQELLQLLSYTVTSPFVANPSSSASPSASSSPRPPLPRSLPPPSLTPSSSLPPSPRGGDEGTQNCPCCTDSKGVPAHFPSRPLFSLVNRLPPLPWSHSTSMYPNRRC